jgi:hypothetical protein
MSKGHEMGTLVIVESHFSNTWSIGEAIAGALPDATLLRVDNAPKRIDPSVNLLILGAPTHAFTLSSAASRTSALERKTAGAQAARRGGFHASSIGLREWIAEATIPKTAKVLTFDTCVAGAGTLFGQAAKKAVARLVANGVNAQYGSTFWVTGADQLRAEETERAAAWARGLKTGE